MLIGIGFGIMFLMNILLWIIVIHEQRQLHKTYKRELQIKMQRLAKLFTRIIIKQEELEKRINGTDG